MLHKKEINIFKGFATDPLRTVEPTAGERATGWSTSDRVPARKLNWCINRNDALTQTIAQAALSQVQVLSLGKAALPHGIDVWVDAAGIKRAVATDGNYLIFTLDNGYEWVQGADYSYPLWEIPNNKNIAVTRNNVIVLAGRADSNAFGLQVRTSTSPVTGSVFTTYLNATPTTSFEAMHIAASNYDDRVIAISKGGHIAYSDTYTTAEWDVVDVAGGSSLQHIENVAVDTWLTITRFGLLYRSVDNAATWTLVSNVKAVGALPDVHTVDCVTSIDGGNTIIVMGTKKPASGAGNQGHVDMAYSTDGGASFTQSDINWPIEHSGSLNNYELGTIVHMGGSILYAGVTYSDYAIAPRHNILFCSVDGGVSWAPCQVNSNAVGSAHIVSTGGHLEGCSLDNVNYVGVSL